MTTGSLTIQRLLGSMKKLDASDLHIKVGIPPTYRIGGVLRAIDSPPISEDEADHLLDPIMSPAQKEKFDASGNLDFSTSLPDGDRFRVNVFRAGAHTHAAIRRVKAEIPSYEQLNLPAIYSKIVSESSDGLVLVVGVTGSGKSSTLAAMVEQINQTRAENIITIEDPVEYRIVPKKSIISQREIGIDVNDYPTALRYVVREDPDVVMIGELRDHATVLAAIQAAETGHLVFGSMHTADTMQAFSRMLEFFPPSERAFIRTAIGNTLRAICAQKLLPALEGFNNAVVPATEVLLGTSLVKEKIREGEDNDLPALINSNTGQDPGEGMHSFTLSLAHLIKKEAISRATGMDHSPNREALDSILKGVEVKASTLVSRIKKPGA
ncbi:MAG: PilT/PilU family type 4a pilus ATPase [Phycisphaerales bacterium]|nr:PilT/PilU family type 4a pilus ATPase [Planctomycetota bacterium]